MLKKSTIYGVVAWGLAALLNGTTCWGQGLEVKTDDGLALHLTEDGRVRAISVDGKPLPRPGEATGGFTLLDVEAYRASLGKAENVLPNGSFELDEDGNNLPDGWNIGNADGKWTWDTGVAHTGRRSMKVTLAQMEKPGVSGSLSPARRMPVKPHQRYRLSFWVKTENSGGKYPPAVYVQQFNAEGKWAVPQRGVPAKKGTNDWFQRAVEFRISPKTVSIDVYANIYRSHGAAWFDDFRLISTDEKLYTGTVLRGLSPRLPSTRGQSTKDSPRRSFRERGDDLDATYVDEKLGLKLNASHVTKPGRMRIDIEVEDLRKTDRRVVVGYVIPLDASGWTWWDNICAKRRVGEPTVYRWTCRTEMGDAALSIYPFNSLGAGDVALTLGVPLDQGPRIWNVGYDHARKQLSISFHLGISQVTTKFPGKATCSFILYRHDAAWGMRAAAKRFYEFYPQHFVKRFPFEAHMNYADLARLDGDTGAISFGYGRHSTGRAEDGSDLGESIPWFIAEHGGYHGARWPGRGPEPPPTDDEVRAYLTSKGDARSLAQITHDHNGAIRYHRKEHGGRYAPKEGGWFFELRVHEDPEIGDWVPRRVRAAWARWRKQHPDLPPFHVKQSSDEIMGYTGTGRGPDYRVDHLPYTDVPLSFHKDSLVLGRVNLSYDLLKGFYWPDSQDKKYLLTGNANWFNRSFCCPYVDCGMVEWEWDRSNPLRTGIYARTMCYQKLWRFWRVLRHGKYAEKDPEAVRLHFHRCLHWAIYPAGLYALDAGGRTGNHDTFRHLYRRYEPIVEILSGSGWEPITHARLTDKEVLVERYGYFDRGTLHFAVRNTSQEEHSADVTVDAQALGVAMDGALRCWDLTKQRPVPLNRDAKQVMLSLRIPPGETRVVHLADSRGRWLMALEQMRRGIDRIERHYWQQTRGKDEMAAAKKALARLRAPFETEPDSAPGLAEATNLLYRALEAFRSSLRVSGTINRDKMFYRVYDEFSSGPGELLAIELLAPNDWPGVRKGRAIEVTALVRNTGGEAVSEIKIDPECPFPDASLAVLHAPRTLAPGASGEARFRFTFAPDTPRNLAPVLFRLTARRGGATCTTCRVLDIRLLKNAQLSLLPLMLNTAPGAQKLTLTVSNPHAEPLDGTLSISPPEGWDVSEGKQTIRVPASSSQRAAVSVAAPKDAADGQVAVTAELTPKGEPVERQEFTVSVRGNRPRVVVPRLAQGPQIDDRIEPDGWRGAAEVSDFTVLNRPTRADVQTRVKLGLHRDSLYIGFICDEPLMSNLRAAITKEGDRVWSDDSVEVRLAPGHVSATQFIVNAVGTRGGTVTLPWTVSAKRFANVWQAEIMIPLRALCPEPPSVGDIWGLQLCRSRKAGGTTVNSTWSPGRGGFSSQAHFGDLVLD